MKLIGQFNQAQLNETTICYVSTEIRTDPNYRKASLKKIYDKMFFTLIFTSDTYLVINKIKTNQNIGFIKHNIMY